MFFQEKQEITAQSQECHRFIYKEVILSLEGVQSCLR